MGELDAIKMDKIVRLIKKHGYTFRAKKGSHEIYVKQKHPKIVLPKHGKDAPRYISEQVAKYLNLSKKDFFIEIRKL